MQLEEKKQEISITEEQLYQLINDEFIWITKQNNSTILISVKKRIDENTFPTNKWINRLKRLFICQFIGHKEVGVYSWISYCYRCNYSWNPSELCSQCKNKYSNIDDE